MAVALMSFRIGAFVSSCKTILIAKFGLKGFKAFSRYLESSQLRLSPVRLDAHEASYQHALPLIEEEVHSWCFAPNQGEKVLGGKDQQPSAERMSPATSTVKDLSSAIEDVEASMRNELEAFREHLQRTVASQVELIFNKLDDLVVNSRLTVLEQKVKVFANELDDLIEERIAHFTKWEVQRCKDLKGQVTELQEELTACKKSLQELQGRALDIDDEEKKVQTTIMYLTDTTALWWRRRYTDGCDVKTWEKFKCELKRQFYSESVEDMAMINLRRLRQKGSIHEYVKEYSALMLVISEMSERQRLCFFVDRLQQWVATELRRIEPHDLASTMVIVQRLEDFKQGERPRSPRHERAKDGGDGRSKSGLPKATDDEQSGDEGQKVTKAWYPLSQISKQAKTMGSMKSRGMQPNAPNKAMMSPKNGNIAATVVATITDNDLVINRGTTLRMEN
ncbi:hypothetical protein RJ639_007696 [Escallonia herrerae]|uniref:Ty3 transposon capsid-like protein domain-containing protein n=1 Tax=Escallonia herrerae TaxID=1293975 RepID=A0AA89AT62_9ASTE|nr:hypothetical protein RJ639_007696 [Escallonia herrerae]